MKTCQDGFPQYTLSKCIPEKKDGMLEYNNFPSPPPEVGPSSSIDQIYPRQVIWLLVRQQC